MALVALDVSLTGGGFVQGAASSFDTALRAYSG